MFKLNFRLQLPIVQLLLAVTLLVWGRRVSQPAGMDFPYSPTAILLCKGINAPAALFAVICDSLLPLDRPDMAPVSIFGFNPQDILFLLGVIVIWYLVGRVVDQKAKHQAPSDRRGRSSKTLIHLALMTLGILVLLMGTLPILDKRGLTNPMGAAIASVLYMARFGVLFFLPAVSLLRIFRGQSS
jgi:hypothetical protein